MTLAGGARLGPYEILSPLGAGGMGEVYRARDTKLKREVAVKVLPDLLARDPEALARFEREAHIVAALNHPNILSIHDFGREESTVFAVTELLEGETLRARLERSAVPQRRAVEIGIAIARGLAAAHAKGIVHRDLKPENVFLTSDGRVKILDFGLAKSIPIGAPGKEARTAPLATEPGTVLGTVGYMSPEQVRGKDVDTRSDIFSFGAILYEMLSGRRAFQAETSVETLNAILKEDPPELSQSERGVPPALDQIVRRCLEKSPDARFHSASDLAFALAAVTASSGITTPTAIRPAPRPVRGHRAAAFALGGLALAAAAFFAGRWSSRDTPLDRVHFRRLTYRRGSIESARFLPGGESVVYDAAWEGRPRELFSTQLRAAGDRPLGIAGSPLASVSNRGELAVLVNSSPGLDTFLRTGTLARLSLSGGAPREIASHTLAADWAPNGEDLAVLIDLPTTTRLEYPAGRKLCDIDDAQSLRVSPRGDRIAVVEAVADGSGFAIRAVERDGRSRLLTQAWYGLRLAWAPAGEEILFSGYRQAGDSGLYAIDLAGRVRTLLPTGGSIWLDDASPDGKLLVERVHSQNGIEFASGGGGSVELGFQSNSWVTDISTDGGTIVFQNQSEGNDFAVYSRRTDGSPPVRLGSGEDPRLSPDGKWVLALRREKTGKLVLLPTGAGTPRELPLGELNAVAGSFGPAGTFIALLQDQAGRVFVSEVNENGKVGRPFALESLDVSAGFLFSRSEPLVAYGDRDGRIHVASTRSGASRVVPGRSLAPGERLVQMSLDGRFGYAVAFATSPASITLTRIDLASGERSPWKQVRPADPTGVTGFSTVALTPDGKSFAYSYNRKSADDLFVVEGLIKPNRR